MKTFSAKAHEVKRDWIVIDATDAILGRLSTEIARRLRGKHKSEYTPHVDTGDYIVVTNVEKLKVTGQKFKEKIYYHHSIATLLNKLFMTSAPQQNWRLALNTSCLQPP